MSNAMRRSYVMLFLVVSMCVAFLSGCCNVMTRNPISDMQIGSCYQSTGLACTAAALVAFPQSMGAGPTPGFIPENIFTIPLGIVVLADGTCEFCLDTVFLPVDYFLSKRFD